MKTDDFKSFAEVIYRANRTGGGEAELRLSVEPQAATVADAWARLTAAFDDVDPMSLEIEIRHAPAARPAAVWGMGLSRQAQRRPAAGARAAVLEHHR